MTDDAARRASVKRALRTNAQLRKLFAQLGGTDAPRGRVMNSYRVARMALRGALSDWRMTRDILNELRRAVYANVTEIFEQAQEVGTLQAIDDLGDFGLDFRVDDPREGMLLTSARISTLLPLEQQINNIQAQLLTGIADDSLILGDETRVGLLAPGAVLREGTRWITTLALAAYTNRVQAAAAKTKQEFKRQAVAALDARTTDCCLRVHGQVVGLEQDFNLTGTPRYASRLRNPPFHWYCRTATALLRAEQADDDLTQEMLDAASAELDARERTGKRAVIHPAHATSRRG